MSVKLRKIICIILIFLVLFNRYCPNISLAEASDKYLNEPSVQSAYKEYETNAEFRAVLNNFKMDTVQNVNNSSTQTWNLKDQETGDTISLSKAKVISYLNLRDTYISAYDKTKCDNKSLEEAVMKVYSEKYSNKPSLGANIRQNADNFVEGAVDMWDTIVPTNLIDGIVGVMTVCWRVLAMVVGGALQGLASVLGHSAGKNPDADTFITVEDVLFNRLLITDINFFQYNTGSDTIEALRTNIAVWYYVLRNLAIIILLCILIYVGIRMAISTVASEKAVYKTMFKDWLVSFILVFFMHYIILMTVQLNNSLVSIFAQSIKENAGTAYMDDLVGLSFSASAVKAWAATMIYVMMAFFTMGFLWSYIKRMITLAFLIIISPLVTVTYAIDKMGDGKSQALDTWIKEYVYTILLQPFQCVIYLALTKNSIMMMTQDKGNIDLGLAVLVIISLFFTFEAEKIVRKIFGFDKASSMANAFAASAATFSLMTKASKLGGKAKTPAGKAANKAGSASTNAMLAQNRVANKNIAKAGAAAKEALQPITSAVSSKAAEIGNKVATSPLGTKVAAAGNIVATSPFGKSVADMAEQIKQAPELAKKIENSVKDAAVNGKGLDKVGANIGLAAIDGVKNVGKDIKKDIKGAVTSVGNYTRSLTSLSGAIQGGMTMVGVAAGLTTGDAANAITYGIAGNEIGAKMAAPAQERYAERQERKFADNYRDLASTYGNIGNPSDYDLTTAIGQENMKNKAKDLNEKGEVGVKKEYKESYEDYIDKLAHENAGVGNTPTAKNRSDAAAEMKRLEKDILMNNGTEVKSKLERLRNGSDEDKEKAKSLERFANAVADKDFYMNNISRMIGIEQALGNDDAEKTVVTGEGSLIDRVNAGIEE